MLRNTARVAAIAMLEIVQTGDQLGVSWGETIRSVADSVPNHWIESVSVTQVSGSMDADRLPAAETCAIRIANRLNAHCYTLHAPARLSTVELADALRTEPAIEGQLARFDSLDCILYSIGDVTPQNAHGRGWDSER